MDIQSTIEPTMQNISDSDRKQAKINEHIQTVLNFFSTISKGLMKIVEEISSLVFRR